MTEWSRGPVMVTGGDDGLRKTVNWYLREGDRSAQRDGTVPTRR